MYECSHSNSVKEYLARQILQLVEQQSRPVAEKFRKAEQFFKELIAFGLNPQAQRATGLLAQDLTQFDLVLPLQRHIYPAFVSEENRNKLAPYDPNPLRIVSMLPSVTVIKSKEMPKKITFRCSDRSEKAFLLKRIDNAWREQWTMDFVNYANEVLRQDSASRGIQMSSYSVIALTKNLALIEWCGDT